MKRKIILMVGLPCTGKSTYINEQLGGSDKNFIISRDDIREQVALEAGMSYEDLFVYPNVEEKDGQIAAKGEQYGIVEEKEFIKEVKEGESATYISYSKVSEMNAKVNILFNQKVEDAKKQTNPVVVDMTNRTQIERNNIIQQIRGDMDISKFKEIFEVSVVHFDYDTTKMEPLITLAKVRHDEIVKKALESGITMGKPITKETFDFLMTGFERPTIKEEMIDVVTTKEVTKMVLWLLDLKAPELAKVFLDEIKDTKKNNSPKQS